MTLFTDGHAVTDGGIALKSFVAVFNRNVEVDNDGFISCDIGLCHKTNPVFGKIGHGGEDTGVVDFHDNWTTGWHTDMLAFFGLSGWHVGFPFNAFSVRFVTICAVKSHWINDLSGYDFYLSYENETRPIKKTDWQDKKLLCE